MAYLLGPSPNPSVAIVGQLGVEEGVEDMHFAASLYATVLSYQVEVKVDDLHTEGHMIHRHLT